jgi:hypothetical protein
MSPRTSKLVASVVIWLATFCILLFGGFSFTSAESRWKTVLGVGVIAAAFALTMAIWRRRPVEAGHRDAGSPNPA